MSGNRNQGNRGQMPTPPVKAQEVPSLDVPDNTGTSEQPEAPKEDVAPKKEVLEVRALRKGFFGGMRIEEGQVFLLGSRKQLGTWMQFTDPLMEKKRREEESEAGK